MRLIFFPFHDWRKGLRQGFRTRDGHILQGLLRHADVTAVLCVNRPVPLPLWPTTVHRMPRAHRLTQEQEKLFVLDSLDLTFPRLVHGVYGWWPSAASAARRKASVRQALRTLGWEATRTAALCCTPYDAFYLPELGLGTLGFDAIDDWEIHPLMRRGADAARAGYEVVRRSFDVAFAVSEPLADRLRGGRVEVVELRNGVSDAMLAAPVSPGGRAIGYAGKLSYRIDLEAVAAAAAVSPSPLHIAGPILDSAFGKALRQIPNCKLVGDVPYAELPSFIDTLRVALIPHSVGEQENGGDPIKLYEYLARGKTVVTTPILGVDRFAGTSAVRIARAEVFGAAVSAAYANPAAAEDARALLRTSDTWTAKTDVIVRRLRESLATASPG